MGEHLKTVSIIIPVYNVEQYIAECLDSVIHQTYRGLEIICVDDKSTDRSAEILRDYSQKDHRITVIQNQRNLGQASSRNIGLATATGDYILFLDSDDWLDTRTVEKCLACIEQTQADFVGFGLQQHILDHNQVALDCVCNTTQIVQGKIDAYMFSKIGVTVCTKFFRRSFLSEYGIKFPEGRLYEDNAFSWICCVCARTVSLMPDCFYHYRKRANSTMTTTHENTLVKNLDLIEVLQYFYDYLQQNDYWKTQKQNFSICVDSLMTTALRNVVPPSQRSEFIQYFQTRAQEWDRKPLRWSLTYDLIHKGRIGSWNLYRWVKSIRKRIAKLGVWGGAVIR